MKESMQLRHVELYSGIGGMRLGVSFVLPPHVKHTCKAVDVNTNANRVYEHNFGERPATQSLEYCTAVDLTIGQRQRQQHDHEQTAGPAAAAYSGSRQPLLWTLSPPCQPYTTTAHSKKEDSCDARATSFSHILGLLPTLQQLPTHILLENVTNFYNSQSHQQMHSVLSTLGYQVFDVALCPSQLGIPHLRPRHYTLARLQSSCLSHIRSSVNNNCTSAFSKAAVQQLCLLDHGREPQQVQWSITWWKHLQQQQQQNRPVQVTVDQHPEEASSQLQQYLQLDWAQHAQPLMDSSAEVQEQVARYALSLNTVARYFKLLDIVTPTMSHHSNCFTKGYGKSIMGTGSYLMEDAAAQQLACKDSRGRYHLTGDPYSQDCMDACSSHAAGSGASAGGGAAAVAAATATAATAAVEGHAVQERRAEGTSRTQQQSGMSSSNIVSLLSKHQELQPEWHCCEVTSGLQSDSEGQEQQQQQGTSQRAVNIGQKAAASAPEWQIAPLLRVRRFTPREVANLLGFPDWFEFPKDITDRQAYALLGNSLSIDAVSYLAHVLLEDVIDGSFYEAS